MKVLVLDVGGTHVKMLMSQKAVRKFASGPRMTPEEMVAEVVAATHDWAYDVVSIGYPGVVVHDTIIAEPHNLGHGWLHFDFAQAFHRPVHIVNDAAMQALGSYRGKRMLFLGLGTGLGSAMVVDGVLEPMELGHLPYRKHRTYEDYVGAQGLARSGKKKWRKHVLDVIARLSAALAPDDVVVGGGNARLLKNLPVHVRIGSNSFALTGGERLWTKTAPIGKRV